jgi:membrane protease YdiL (CAAX protease family)
MMPRRKGNYYRGLMRRRLPWVLVTALLLIWAWDLRSAHFNARKPPADYEERSLIYLDRTLRLEDEAVHRQGILSRLLFTSERDEILREARDALESLDNEDLLTGEGLRALAVTCDAAATPLDDLTGIDDTTITILSGTRPTNEQLTELTDRLGGNDTANWWDAKLAEKVLEHGNHARLSEALSSYQQESYRLFIIQLACSAVWWILLVAGLLFIPHACRIIRRNWIPASLHRPVRYGSRWDPTIVIALLVSADLIASYVLEGGYFSRNVLAEFFPIETGFAFDVFMDSVWRILAPAIALIVLFRKPVHAIRSLGLDKKTDWKLLFAMFSIVSWADLAFSHLVEPWSDFDPTGGIDPMEKGWGGLFYGLLSACVLAPVLEEIFYRGILFRGLLRKFGFWLSASVSTLAFVLAHSYDFFGLVTIGIFGFAMVLIYRATGSLRTAILMHVIYNFAITLPDWLLYHAPFDIFGHH